MSPILTTVVWLATMIAAQGFGLLALWLRLRWRAKQEQMHRQYVVARYPKAARSTRATRTGHG